MAERIEVFHVTVPPNTLQSAPQTTALDFGGGVVEEVELVIPDGVAGLAGIQLLYGPTVVIPRSPDVFVVSNDERIRWPLENYPTGAAWQARTFNIGVFSHTFEVRFLLREIVRAAPSEVLPVPVG